MSYYFTIILLMFRSPDGQITVEVDTLQTRPPRLLLVLLVLPGDRGLLLVQRLAAVCPLSIPLLRHGDMENQSQKGFT